MLTGARRTQIGGLRRHEFSEDEALITLGGTIGIQEAKRLAKLGEVEDESLSKNRRTFLLPLSRQSVALFTEQPVRKDNRHVFGSGEGGYSGWSKSMDELKKIIGDRVKADWGLHDFRRSFETLGQDKVKIADNVTDCCINHVPQSKKGTRKHYNFAMLLDERIAAFQAWADYIEALVKTEEPSRLRLVETAAA
jgi:integrase